MARPDHADDHEDDASISIGRINSTKGTEPATWDTAQMDTFLRSVLDNASFSQVRRPCRRQQLTRRVRAPCGHVEGSIRHSRNETRGDTARAGVGRHRCPLDGPQNRTAGPGAFPPNATVTCNYLDKKM